jgi:hypothetical protein
MRILDTASGAFNASVRYEHNGAIYLACGRSVGEIKAEIAKAIEGGEVPPGIREITDGTFSETSREQSVDEAEE